MLQRSRYYSHLLHDFHISKIKMNSWGCAILLLERHSLDIRQETLMSNIGRKICLGYRTFFDIQTNAENDVGSSYKRFSKCEFFSRTATGIIRSGNEAHTIQLDFLESDIY